MATFGIEGIRHFSHARAAGWDVSDAWFSFNICNGLDKRLRKKGHNRSFYWGETNCWEIDIKDQTKGGIDSSMADGVDLFFICTHGGNKDGKIFLVLDSAKDSFQAQSSDWLLGNVNLEWMMLWACNTIPKGKQLDYWNVFQGLHKLCGSYGTMWDWYSIDECGEDVAKHMTNGKTVAQSWIEGVSDWLLDNHPMVLAMEREETWNGGQFDWPNTTMRRDHLWGHGETVADIPVSKKFWMSWRWAEG